MRTGIRLFAGISVLAWPVLSQAQTQRPISDFLSTQGTYCIPDGSGGCLLFVPPVANFIGWGDPRTGQAVSVDYAGLANEYIEAASGVSLGTSLSGVVTETPNKDGTADVRVELHARNALIFVIADFDFAAGPLVLGHRAPDVASGATPGLANVEFHISFTNTAPGAPLPDLIQLFFFPGENQALHNYSFNATGSGPAPDGTTLKVTVAQTGNIARSNIQAAIIIVR